MLIPANEASDAGGPRALASAERVLLACTAAFLVLAPFSGSSGLRTAMLLIAAFALVASRRAGLLADLATIPRPVRWAGIAWCAWAALSLAWSIAPRFSAGELRTEVSYGLLAFAVFFLAALRLGRWRTWWGALVAGTAAAFAAQLLQDVAGIRLSRHPLDGGPGPWSTHLVLIAPLLLVIIWPRPWGVERGNLAKALALLLVLVAAAQTGNRIVWAAFAAQLGVLLVIARSMPAMQAERSAMLRRLALFAAAALTIGFAGSVLERNVRHFRADPSMTASIDRDIRPRVWSVAWDEFRKAPWLGHGLGREILEAKFLPLAPRSGGHPPVRHAHNTFIDVALQLGLPGLAVLVALLAALAREYGGYLRDARLAPWGIIGLATLAGFVVKNLTDDFFYRHNALVFWALNGMLLGLGQAARTPPRGEP